MIENLTDVGYIALYANGVAIILSIGVIALAQKLRMHDKFEKKLFVTNLALIIAMALFYMLMAFRDDRVFPCTPMGAMLIDTGLELILNAFLFFWLVFVDYRMYHSPDHLKRFFKHYIFPVGGLSILFIINIFTGFLFSFDENLVSPDEPLYIITDCFRLAYFLYPVIMLARQKKRDERLRFFSMIPFVVPIVFYTGIYYFTPYNTTALGEAIGLSLIYVGMINEQSYQDGETGLYNRLYLQHLKNRIEKGDYDLQSAMVFKLTDGDMGRLKDVMASELSEDCETIRYGKNSIISLIHVNDRAPLFMISEDVKMYMEEASMEVDVILDLRKQKETGAEFLQRMLIKA